MGVRRNQLYKWKEQMREGGKELSLARDEEGGSKDEVARLRRELERVKEERDILKKAAAYFAKELK